MEKEILTKFLHSKSLKAIQHILEENSLISLEVIMTCSNEDFKEIGLNMG